MNTNMMNAKLVYIVTIPSEITEPRCDSVASLFSSCVSDDCVSDSPLSWNFSDVCLDPRRGGGDSDMISGELGRHSEIEGLLGFRGGSLGILGETGVTS